VADIDVIRAWKDAKYRRSLTDEQRAALPPNPAGMIELTDDELASAAGLSGAGGKPPPQTTAINCTLYSFQGWKACGCFATTAITCTQYTWNGSLGCCPGD
jgi:mersacidin/lichenicidin family type 2 lantibiotic